MFTADLGFRLFTKGFSGRSVQMLQLDQVASWHTLLGIEPSENIFVEVLIPDNDRRRLYMGVELPFALTTQGLYVDPTNLQLIGLNADGFYLPTYMQPRTYIQRIYNYYGDMPVPFADLRYIR